MKITFFSTQPYDRIFFDEHNKKFGYSIEYFEVPLTDKSVNLIQDSEAICVFVNDHITPPVTEQLAAKGIKVIALRCAGFNNVDLKSAAQHGIRVVRVPAYSPHAVAEHAVAMIMTLNRKTHKAYNRVRDQNFSLHGLIGFDVFGKTVGVIGTGNIGRAFCNIMLGFGCRVLAYDITEDESLVRAGVIYQPLRDVLSASDIVSLHCPLNKNTHHLIGPENISIMKKGVMLINTSRGGLINTRKVIKALKSGQLGALGIDVYEQEETLFFHNLSEQIIADDTIARLMTFPNVLITSHQGFFTQEAMHQIADTTLGNLKAYEEGHTLENEVTIAGL